jgi:hypothetical protein
MKQHWLKKWLPGSPDREPIPFPHDLGQYTIEFDMMLKGHMYERSSGKVRQCAVTVDGATRLVTSGDKVDRATYDALVNFNAIRPLQTETQSHRAEVAD